MLSYLLLAIIFTSCIALLALLSRTRSLQSELADVRLQLRSVLDNMVEGVVVMDTDRNILLMNGIASELISVNEQGASYALVEQQYEAFTPSGDAIPYQDWPSSRALRGEFVKDFPIRHRNRYTGKVGARVMNTAMMPGLRGVKGQIIISYRDDTERTIVDEARNRLASIVESSNDAIVSTTLDGIVMSWNKGAEKILGYSAAELIGKPADCLLPDHDVQSTSDVLERVRLGETLEMIDRTRHTKAGRDILMDISISPIRDASGSIVGASIIARDMTATRNLEKQFQQAQKMEAIGQLTGGIAHDFNNLLGIVSGNLDLLEELLGENEAARSRTKLARKAASRAADLTRRLLAFSSKETLNPRSTSLEHSVRNALEIAIHALGPAIRISTHIDTMRNVYIDPAGLESALLNLMVNARDAMEGGGLLHVLTKAVQLDDQHPYVTNKYLEADEYALISVTDTGHGMTKETLDRVFEPFFTTKERGRGTGLGLPMVYGFARQSKGCVRIYSEPNHGTTVSLYLPFAAASSVEKPKPILLETSLRHVEGRILIVEDEPELLDISSTYLKKLGYETLLATDGPHALQLVEEYEEIDLLVTDIVMPGGINGVELSHVVEKLRPLIKTVYTSGFPEDALAEKNLGIGSNILLNKPYRLTELGDAVNRALQEYPEPTFMA